MSQVISVRPPGRRFDRGAENAVAAAFLTAILTIPVLGLRVEARRLPGGAHAALAAGVDRGRGRVPVPAVQAVARAREIVGEAAGDARDGRAAAARDRLGAARGRLVWPFFGSRGAVDVATLALICDPRPRAEHRGRFRGLLDLGYVGFYAVGGYTYAMLNQYFGLSFWECLPLAAIAAATFGFLLGFPVLRLRGDYLAIVTLGFGEIIRLLANNLTSLTGGGRHLGHPEADRVRLRWRAAQRRRREDLP